MGFLDWLIGKKEEDVPAVEEEAKEEETEDTEETKEKETSESKGTSKKTPKKGCC